MALTGAGISVPSGIPDFRTPGHRAVGERRPDGGCPLDAFCRDPASFWGFYGERFATLDGKRPNPAHTALVRMERAGLLQAVITQNVDMLHRRAGTSELIEVHGSIATCSCSACREAAELQDVRERLRAAADGIPRCQACGAAMRPDVVLFGEMLHRARPWSGPTTCASAPGSCCASAPHSRPTRSPPCRC